MVAGMKSDTPGDLSVAFETESVGACHSFFRRIRHRTPPKASFRDDTRHVAAQEKIANNFVMQQ